MNKKRNLILATLAVVLVICASIAPAMAYFTSYAQASGGIPVALGDHGYIEEDPVTDMTKTIRIQNADDSLEDVYIRASYTVPENLKDRTTVTPGDGWTGPQEDADGNKWYYYSDPVAPGGVTTDLNVEIGKLTEEERAKLKEGDQMEVSVFYESIPVLYDENGAPIPATAADWEAENQAFTE